MSIRTVYTGSTVTFRIETGMDVSTATQTSIRWRSPAGDGEWDAEADGTQIVYTTLANDLPVSGIWSFQAIVDIGQERYKGKIAKFVIQKALPANE